MAKSKDHTKSRTGKKTALSSKAAKSTTGKVRKAAKARAHAYKKSSGGRSTGTGGYTRQAPRVPEPGTLPLEERASLAGFGAAKGLIWMAPDFDEPRRTRV